MATFASTATLQGELPPWEVAKAFAFHTVLAKAAEILDTPQPARFSEPFADIRQDGAANSGSHALLGYVEIWPDWGRKARQG